MYSDSIRTMVEHLALPPSNEGNVIEVGAAGGITKDVYPWIQTTDVRMATGVDYVVDGGELPYPNDSVDGLIAKDALHHIPDPHAHFAEVARVLRPGRRAVYLEPNWNLLSRAVFRMLHPEPFDTGVLEWDRESSDPMDSNQALAYLVFERDLAVFESKHTALRLIQSAPCNGLAFLLSGGVHSRTPLPPSPLIRLKRAEDRRVGLLRHTGLNRVIVLEKRRPNA
jgi:SAM-dependent methyltransferase